MKAEVRRIGVVEGEALVRRGFAAKEIEVFKEYLQSSEQIWGGFANDELVILWGFIPGSLLSPEASIWSWSTPAVQKCRKTFVKLSREAVAKALLDYPILTGFCKGHSHWLRWLGAEFGEQFGEYFSFVIRA